MHDEVRRRSVERAFLAQSVVTHFVSGLGGTCFVPVLALALALKTQFLSLVWREGNVVWEREQAQPYT